MAQTNDWAIPEEKTKVTNWFKEEEGKFNGKHDIYSVFVKLK